MDPKQVTNRRRPSQARSKERVTVILQAVKALIEEKGIANLKVTEIAQRAKTSPGSLYQYFSDKEAIILALAEFYMEQIHEIVQKNVDLFKSLDDLPELIEKNFDEIYQLHHDEVAIREIWFESIDPELNKLAFVDAQLITDIFYQGLCEVVTPADPTSLRQYLLMINLQFGNVMRLCFMEDIGTSQQFKQIYLDTVAASIVAYVK